MKHVIALHSSRRNQNTYGLLTQIQEILLKQDIQVEIISLYDQNIQYCVGCDRCVLTDHCALPDQCEELMEKLKTADGLILSSPVYLQQVSGKLKTFVDRTCRWFHRPPMAGKPILAVSTTKGNGLPATLNYLQKVTEQWGGLEAGKLSRNVRNLTTPVDAKELTQFVTLLHQPEQYRPSYSNLNNFQVQLALGNMMAGIDKTYWAEQNWQDKLFYIPCRISPLKKILFRAEGALLRRVIKPAKNN